MLVQQGNFVPETVTVDTILVRDSEPIPATVDDEVVVVTLLGWSAGNLRPQVDADRPSLSAPCSMLVDEAGDAALLRIGRTERDALDLELPDQVGVGAQHGAGDLAAPVGLEDDVWRQLFAPTAGCVVRRHRRVTGGGPIEHDTAPCVWVVRV